MAIVVVVIRGLLEGPLIIDGAVLLAAEAVVVVEEGERKKRERERLSVVDGDSENRKHQKNSIRSYPFKALFGPHFSSPWF